MNETEHADLVAVTVLVAPCPPRRRKKMATHCCGRRLSDLLQEQQEPFLVKRGRPVAEACSLRRRGVSVSNVGGMLCGARAVRKALLWDLAGCFSCDRFRRSDEETTELSHWDEEEDSKPSSTSDHHPRSNSNGGTVPAMEGEDIKSKFRTRTKREESLAKTEEEQALVSAWERIVADMSRIPRMVELDLSVSAREWRRRVGEEEARQVGESIEAMIFEEVRWEAVRALTSPHPLNSELKWPGSPTSC